MICVGNLEDRHVNVELILGKTDVMRWLFTCWDVENDENCEHCRFEGIV